MGFNQKTWIENYVQSLCSHKITQEKLEVEIKNIVDLMNELFKTLDEDKHVEFTPGRKVVVFPGRKSNIFIRYDVDMKNNEIKIVQHKNIEVISRIEKSVSITCKGDEYIVKDQPSITMDEVVFGSLEEAINCSFSRILN